MTDRAAFLARVRAALGDAPPELAAPPEVDESIARLASEKDDLPALFANRAAEVGMQVHECDTKTLDACLAERLEALGAKRITVSVVDRMIGKACAAATKGVETVDWRGAGSYEPHFDVDAGITDVDAAIAETGTLVVTSGPERARGTWIAVPTHIAVVRTSQLVPDMIDYWKRITGTAPREMPASTVLITGPSKTADIEGVLVEGVHGPRAVHVLLVR